MTKVDTAAPDADALNVLADVLGPKGFTRKAEDLAPWLTDWRGRYTGSACGMASPKDVAEVQTVVRVAAAAGIPVVPQGGNSGMVAGATPDTSGKALLLSLRRMQAMMPIDPVARTIRVEAGVILQHLHEAVTAQGWRFPLTLGGKGSATIGGLVSTNAGGTQVLRHGTMRALVAGLEVVLASGEMLSLLTPLIKDNRGPDLKQLFIGAEGILGIVTAATLRLRPALVDSAALWLTVDTPASALAILDRARATFADSLEGFEIMPAQAVKATCDYLNVRAPTDALSPWHLLVALGSEQKACPVAINAAADPSLSDRIAAFAARLLDDELATDATLAQNLKQAEDFWRLRESISPAMRAKGPALQHDIAIAPHRMPSFLDEDVPQIVDALPGHADAMAFGHLGDGNVHLHINPPRHTAERGAGWIAEHGAQASRIVYERVIAAGGSISAEHGIGLAKRDLLAQLDDPVRLQTLRALKAALDPAGILNPGKLI